jgi:hypothetical protein
MLTLQDMNLTGFFRFLILILLTTGLHACGEDEEPPLPSTTLDGEYDLLSYYADVAVDLNRDGVFSHDLLAEMKDAPTFPNYSYHLEFRTTILGDATKAKNHVQQMQLWLPKPTVFVDTQTGEFLYTGYGLTSSYAFYKYSADDKTVSVTPVDFEGKIVAVWWVDEPVGVLSVKFEQEYYTTDWEELIITGTYKKRP